ncbi:TetR/AcrR family transcriptional regulator [Heyndrickxia acidiproducens]|uniref:TetR/AcrR family transcriptional regulator n=1 Tax=Heyndrickxia acidiproducens TaxID=1121084 RepID=UPI00036FD2A1|nr:TetR/AcrR family transcriptional regulator [Heyndrickxia acidiproducens]
MSKKQNTRESIIHTAKYLFQIQGYHATGINQIIKDSGAPKGSLYYHFPNGKEEIAIAAIDSVKNEVKEEVQLLLSSYEDPVEAIQAQFLHVASKVLNDQQVEFRIGLIASESVSTSENIREACKSAYHEWMSLISDYLVQKGYSRESAEQTAALVYILMEGAMTMSITYQDVSFFKMLAEKTPYILKNT